MLTNQVYINKSRTLQQLKDAIGQEINGIPEVMFINAMRTFELINFAPESKKN